MQELVKQLVEKAGLSEEAAQKAVDTTLEYVKTKVPPMFQDKIEDIFSGKFDVMSLLSSFMGGANKGAEGQNADSPLDALKGMFGK